jgi:LacI family transcriptional regulator
LEKLIRNRKKTSSTITIKPTRLVTRASTDIYSTPDLHIVTALKFIHNHIDTNLSVKDVLDEVPLSRRSLEKRFLDITGYPVYKYIFNLRIEKFAEQLELTDKSISEIAHGLGLNDAKNIARQFRQIKGMTPRHYRQTKIAKKMK